MKLILLLSFRNLYLSLYLLSGFGHTWKITIGWNLPQHGEQSSPSITPLISEGASYKQGTAYAAPMVIQYIGSQTVNVVDLDTEGNQQVSIEGRNFGSKALSPGSIDSVSYGSYNGQFKAEGCKVELDHTKITCSTVRGAGTDHQWYIRVGGQDSQAPSTGYALPVVNGFQAAASGDAINPDAMLTKGGQSIVLVGLNFGPIAPSFLEKVTYGATGSEYECRNATIIENSKKVRCITSAGIGERLIWHVRVGGQTGYTAKDVHTSYAKPVIASFSPVTGPTSGSTELVLKGSNFGIRDVLSGLDVLLGGKVQRGVITEPRNSGPDVLRFSLEECGAKATPCGQNKTVEVAVTTPDGQLIAATNNKKFSYE